MQVRARLTVLPLARACVSFCLAGASLLRSATARVVLQPDWNYSHSGHDRVQSRSSEGGSAKKLFCCLVAFSAFHKEKCSALKKGNIFFFFFNLRTLQCLRCVGRRQPNSLSCTHTNSILYIKNNNKKNHKGIGRFSRHLISSGQKAARSPWLL